MTFEIEIPTDIQPFGWEIRATQVLDEQVIGFDPDAVELRSLWLNTLLEKVCTNA